MLSALTKFFPMCSEMFVHLKQFLKELSLCKLTFQKHFGLFYDNTINKYDNDIENDK